MCADHSLLLSSIFVGLPHGLLDQLLKSTSLYWVANCLQKVWQRQPAGGVHDLRLHGHRHEGYIFMGRLVHLLRVASNEPPRGLKRQAQGHHDVFTCSLLVCPPRCAVKCRLRLCNNTKREALAVASSDSFHDRLYFSPVCDEQCASLSAFLPAKKVLTFLMTYELALGSRRRELLQLFARTVLLLLQAALVTPDKPNTAFALLSLAGQHGSFTPTSRQLLEDTDDGQTWHRCLEPIHMSEDMDSVEVKTQTTYTHSRRNIGPRGRGRGLSGGCSGGRSLVR